MNGGDLINANPTVYQTKEDLSREEGPEDFDDSVVDKFDRLEIFGIICIFCYLIFLLIIFY